MMYRLLAIMEWLIFSRGTKTPQPSQLASVEAFSQLQVAGRQSWAICLICWADQCLNYTWTSHQAVFVTRLNHICFIQRLSFQTLRTPRVKRAVHQYFRAVSDSNDNRRAQWRSTRTRYQFEHQSIPLPSSGSHLWSVPHTCRYLTDDDRKMSLKKYSEADARFANTNNPQYQTLMSYSHFSSFYWSSV